MTSTRRKPVRRSASRPNGIKYKKNGWTYISVSGEPYERGYDYGRLIAPELAEVQRIIPFVVFESFGVKWEFFIDAAKTYFLPRIRADFPEFFDEMRGVADGCAAGGTPMDIHEIVAWNNYFTLTEGWFSHMPDDARAKMFGDAAPDLYRSKMPSMSREGCSAFMAVGKDWTSDGRIVMAHNNFSDFIDGQLANVVLDIRPSNGNRILMLGFPGWIWSGTDFFITSAGIMGTETTIGGFVPYEHKVPISCRIRQAMQYGTTLDDYARILLKDNSGDYANSWLFGDIASREIMRIELGLRFHNIEKTTNGYFIGFNAAYDPRIRNLECVDTGFNDVRRHQGSRRVRLEQLMNIHKGHIDTEIAKQIMADHYDVYLQREENPCSRTCCAHYDLDAREYMSTAGRPLPFQGRGAVDGNVCDSNMAKNMEFELRYGTSCGRAFSVDEWTRQHPQWSHFRPYVWNRPSQPWTRFRIHTQSESKHSRRRNNGKTL